MYTSGIIKLIENEFLPGTGIKIGERDSLFRSNLLDSMMLVRLISRIEEDYNIQISSREIIPANFDTVGSIVKFIEKKVRNK